MTNPQLCYYNPALITARDETIETDICVYGGNAAGVMAAVQASRMGLRAVVLEPSGHLGGLTTGGLSCTDFGNKSVVGGLALELYQRMGAHYGVPSEWMFEPHVAAKMLHQFIEEAGVPFYLRQFLRGVEKEGGRIRSLEMEGGLKVRARMFLDCTYEGDLMGAADVATFVGREDNAVYTETLSGAQMLHSHQFDNPVDPYIVEGDEASGLLPGIETSDYEEGKGDARMQAYNFRLILSKDPANQIAFEQPEGYDAREYELLKRYLKTGWNKMMNKYDEIRGDKCDMNNHGAVSTDFIGRNFDYPLANYARREEIFQAHVTYQKGLMWFRSNDPAVPADIREQQRRWALTRDEFVETGGWPHQLYIREARRLVGQHVMTQHDCQGAHVSEDAIGLAAYTMDSHNCRRLVVDGKVRNEGDVQVGVKPYPVALGAIQPRRSDCENLLVPVCLSSSHIAYGSIRMEPVFMVLAQSAATAAALAIENGSAVQDIKYDELKPQLEKGGQVLAWTA